jgi:hypothetical protein
MDRLRSRETAARGALDGRSLLARPNQSYTFTELLTRGSPEGPEEERAWRPDPGTQFGVRVLYPVKIANGEGLQVTFTDEFGEEHSITLRPTADEHVSGPKLAHHDELHGLFYQGDTSGELVGLDLRDGYYSLRHEISLRANGLTLQLHVRTCSPGFRYTEHSGETSLQVP